MKQYYITSFLIISLLSESKSINLDTPAKYHSWYVKKVAVSWVVRITQKAVSQNKDTLKFDSAKKCNRCHAMIRHQNAGAMVLASALMKGIRPPDNIQNSGCQGGKSSHKRTG